MLTKGLEQSPLFAGMTLAEAEAALQSAGAEIVSYPKNALVFTEETRTKKLYLLAEGKVSICKNSYTGKESIVAAFEAPGELFGEVYTFLSKPFEYFAVAKAASRVLEIPAAFLEPCQDGYTRIQGILVHNMLLILAEKAYFLNRKLQIMASGNLRQKLAKLLLNSADSKGNASLGMTREALANYLSVARPSLSRELMNMQKEGLIAIRGRRFILLDKDALANCL